jgi:hypothetical protein
MNMAKAAQKGAVSAKTGTGKPAKSVVTITLKQNRGGDRGISRLVEEASGSGAQRDSHPHHERHCQRAASSLRGAGHLHELNTLGCLAASSTKPNTVHFLAWFDRFTVISAARVLGGHRRAAEKARRLAVSFCGIVV